VGQVRWKIFTQHAISATLPSTYKTYYNLWKFDEVMTQRKMQFFETRYIICTRIAEALDSGQVVQVSPPYGSKRNTHSS